MKLAQALTMRKQLAQKVDQLKPIKMQGDQGLFETKIQRKTISDTIDELTISAPKITLAKVTEEFDMYATALRKIDEVIQQANWECDVEFTPPPAIK